MTDEFEDNNTQLNSESELPSPDSVRSSRWLPVALGLLGVVLILALAWPLLRGQIVTQPDSGETSLAELEQAVAGDPQNDALHSSGK